MKKFSISLLLVLIACVWNDSCAENHKLPSLCDEWNILGRYATGLGAHDFITFTHRLAADTVINENNYIQLEE